MQIYNQNFILNSDNRDEAIGYLKSVGYSDAALAILPNVQLINTYHKEGWTRSPVATDVQRATAAAVFATIETMPQGRFADEELVRYLARDEAQKIIDQTPPRQLEIISARGNITLTNLLHYRTELVIKIASIGHAIMLVGPAGCGKTTIGEHVAKALQLPFFITSTINDTHELIGFVDGYGKYHDTPFRNAYEHGGVWVADEIDAWDASALLAANSALANGYANFPDRPEPINRHNDFRMIATANTFGTGADRVYVGRNELDAASLDRFATIDIDYDLMLERIFAGANDRWLERVWKIRKAVNDKKIRHVVSSRAIAMGAAALSIGIDWKEVENIYLFKGMSEKDRSKIDG